MHDTGWPYGRRDLYYNPETIPEEYRKPYAMKGMTYGVSELTENGFNGHLFNAVYEGGSRNGVLTAVEDFLKESPLKFHIYQYNDQFGLQILTPKKLTDKQHHAGTGKRRLKSRSVRSVKLRKAVKKKTRKSKTIAVKKKPLANKRKATSKKKSGVPRQPVGNQKKKTAHKIIKKRMLRSKRPETKRLRKSVPSFKRKAAY